MDSEQKKKTGIKDIAKLANVSIGTVDRVIHNRGEVSEKTRKKVLTIIRKFDYKPDILARRLASKKSYTFACLIPGFDNENTYWEAPSKGFNLAKKEFERFGVTIRICMFDQFDKKDFKIKAQQVEQLNPDAVLIAPVFYDETVNFVQNCTQNNVPFVFIDSTIEGIDSVSYIGQNAYQSGYLSAKLISYGAPDSACFLIANIAKASENRELFRLREKGFADFFTANNLNKITVKKITITESDFKSISNIVNKAIVQFPKIHGIFVVNSRAHLIAKSIEKTKAKGTRIIGYDLIQQNIDYLKQEKIDFLISQRPEEQGYKGISTLFNHLILNEDVEKTQYMPIDIITKENIKYYINY